MTVEAIEKIYQEMKWDMVKLSKKQLTEMYNTLYSVPLKAYHGKERIVSGICRYFENIARTNMLKL